MKKLRQGQTIWVIRNPFSWHPDGPYIEPVFLYSQKMNLPPPYVVIEKMPVTFARQIEAEGYPIYRTRRKAQRALKELIK